MARAATSRTSMPNVRRPLMTAAETATYIGGVSERWVRGAVHQRTIPYVKTGALLRFDPDAIDSWLAENSFEPGDR